MAQSPRALTFARPEDWGDWLAARHDKDREVWLRLAKKASGIASIDWEQAVEEALVWGWIDSQKKADEDGRFWLQRFTPRGAKSLWSQKNRATAERLIAGGWMQPAGLAEVEAAKADGRWDAAYAGQGSAEVPEDFLAALATAPERARETYDALDSRNRYALYHRLTTAKKPETRAKRIADFVAMLARGERFHN